LLGTDSCDALFTRGSGRLSSPSVGSSGRTGTWGGLGTLRGPFSAHRYKDIEQRLSQATLAHRGSRGSNSPSSVSPMNTRVTPSPTTTQPYSQNQRVSGRGFAIGNGPKVSCVSIGPATVRFLPKFPHFLDHASPRQLRETRSIR
jgi:hypothetical protein